MKITLNAWSKYTDFLVQFDFEESELRNGLSRYASERPREAISLLLELQAVAILELNRDQQTA
jgi:hypothetical protein